MGGFVLPFLTVNPTLVNSSSKMIIRVTQAHNVLVSFFINHDSSFENLSDFYQNFLLSQIVSGNIHVAGLVVLNQLDDPLYALFSLRESEYRVTVSIIKNQFVYVYAFRQLAQHFA